MFTYVTHEVQIFSNFIYWIFFSLNFLIFKIEKFICISYLLKGQHWLLLWYYDIDADVTVNILNKFAMQHWHDTMMYNERIKCVKFWKHIKDIWEK